MKLDARLSSLEARAPAPVSHIPLEDAVEAWVAILQQPSRRDPSWDGITAREAERRYMEAIGAA